ncbi:MAG: multi-sensor hybrid histidine kinase [Labilithrix sp.]|nr:multi-sensor hybrid histidine kinase [Labilithrix sp.]
MSADACSPEMLAAVPAAVLVLDASLLIESANPHAEGLLANGRGLVGRAFSDGTGLSPSLAAALGDVLRTGRSFTVPGYALAGTGEPVFLDLTFRRLAGAGGPRLLVFGIDVTARVTAVTAQSAALAELRDANLRLAENSRLKSEFVANMSHELRTPLNAILGFTQLLTMEPAAEPTTARQKDFLDRILRNGKNLLSLVDGVLDVARIEAGMRTIYPEHFDLVASLQEAFGSLEALAHHKKLSYRMKVVGTFPPVFTDRGRLHQIVINLLSNALKFTREGGVSLVVTREDGRAVIDVEDTGIGIEPENVVAIFDRFRQVDGSTTRNAGGIGLGLTIAKDLSRLLGAELEVQSALGQGSRFRLTLPLDGPAELGPPSERGEEEGPPSLGAASEVPRPVVLVIEDHPDSAVLMRETLEGAGFRARVAENGVAGLRLARSIRPAAITLDIMMPHMDGWRVLQALRDDEHTAAIPIIVCSVVDHRVMGYRLGASGYLTKPVEPTALLAALAKVAPSGERAGAPRG